MVIVIAVTVAVFIAVVVVVVASAVVSVVVIVVTSAVIAVIIVNEVAQGVIPPLRFFLITLYADIDKLDNIKQ